MLTTYCQTVAAVAAWHVRASELLPSRGADVALPARVLACAYWDDENGADGALDAMVGILSEGEAIARTGAGFDTGDAMRALHAWIRPAHPNRDPEKDYVPNVAPAPDPYTAVRADVRRGRNRKHSTTVVTRHGTPYVVGAWHASEHSPTGAYSDASARVWLPGARAAIEDCRAGVIGRNGRDLAEKASHAYGLPMLGTDVRAFAEIIPTDLATSHYVAPLARHRADLVDAAGIGDSHAVAALARFASIGGASVKRRTSRLKLPAIVRRIADPRPEHAGELTAPSWDPDRMFIGHRHVRRGARASTANRGAWNARIAGIDQTDAPMDATEVADRLGHVVAMLNRGERATFNYPGVRGTVSRAKTGRVTVSVRGPRVTADRSVLRGARTDTAVQRFVLSHVH